MTFHTAILITSLPIAMASTNISYLYDVDVQIFDSSVQLIYTLEDSPKGMTIDSGTGKITWTPGIQQIGKQGVTVAIADSDSPPNTARQTFQIDVRDNQPVFPGDAWEKASPESQGIDSALLANAIDFLESLPAADGSTELVIVRNGFVIWQGANADNVHGTWSLTKSFTSTVFGLLKDDQKVTLETLASDVDYHLKRHYASVTMRHFLTMTSGYRAVGDAPAGDYVHGPSQTPFDPDIPLFMPPGSQLAYWDSAANELGFLITKMAGKSMKAIFQERIGSAIGLDPKAWDWGDFGQVEGLTINGGAGNLSKHVFISAIGLARFGHLILNRGCWDGNQLIDPNWIDAAVHVQVSVDIPWAGRGPDSLDARGAYGWLWWNNGIRADGNRKWPGAPSETHAASGYNNNKLFVIPELNMVVVRLGLDAGATTKIQDSQWGRFLALVGQASIK